MNSILDDYSDISEIELNTRVAYYESIDFFSQTINWLIPDVNSYIKKIFYCLNCAEQSRMIIEDICKQNSDYRKSHNRIVNSIAYKVGTLYVDGRAYVWQNVHMYCQYISEINDCLCQTLNIIYDVGYRQWDNFDGKKILDKLKQHPKIVKLCGDFHSSTSIYKDFDNYAKHNLVLWGKEKFSPEYFLNIDYHFDMYDKQYKMSEFMNESQETQIKISIVKLLDNIFASIDESNYFTRKYVQSIFDFNINDDATVICDNEFLPISKFISVYYKTKHKEGLTYVESVSHYCEDSPISPVIYLARLDQTKLDKKTVQTSLNTIDFNEIDVYQNNLKIGKYICKNKKDKTAKYFHFKKFEFVKL